MRKNAKKYLCFRFGKENLTDDVQLADICLTIFMIKGTILCMHEYINNEKTHTADFVRAQVLVN